MAKEDERGASGASGRVGGRAYVFGAERIRAAAKPLVWIKGLVGLHPEPGPEPGPKSWMDRIVHERPSNVLLEDVAKDLETLAARVRSGHAEWSLRTGIDRDPHSRFISGYSARLHVRLDDGLTADVHVVHP